MLQATTQLSSKTVGVGQGEIEIVRMADTVVVVLVPGMGDSVQALKAGILEIADVFCVNKADHDGVDRLERELITLQSLGEAPPWKAPITKTVATTGTGVPELIAAIKSHQQWAQESGALVPVERVFVVDVFKRSLGELFPTRSAQYGRSSRRVVAIDCKK